MASKRNEQKVSFMRPNELGDRIGIRKEVRPNDKCPCGSGKKAKHCCGSGKQYENLHTKKG